jgi:hypothetical protein
MELMICAAFFGLVISLPSAACPIDAAQFEGSTRPVFLSVDSHFPRAAEWPSSTSSFLLFNGDNDAEDRFQLSVGAGDDLELASDGYEDR